MKFTFKTEKPTGRYASFYNDSHYIKLKGIRCGRIEDKTFRIRLQVYKTEEINDGNKNCEWMWITLQKKSSSLLEAKQFLNENIDAILNKYKIYLSE